MLTIRPHKSVTVWWGDDGRRITQSQPSISHQKLCASTIYKEEKEALDQEAFTGCCASLLITIPVSFTWETRWMQDASKD